MECSHSIRLALLSLPFLLLIADASPASAAGMTLEDAWGLAYRNNPSLEGERAKLRAEDEQVGVALSHWRPDVEVTGSVGRTYQYLPSQTAFGGSPNFADNASSYGVQVTQPLFRGFRTRAETEAAKKQVLAGRAQLQGAEQQLLLDTATAFLDIVRDEYLLGIDRENEQVLTQKLTETRDRARVGELTQTDVQQAQSRLARATVARVQTETALQADRDSFTRLTGDEAGTLQKPTLALATGQTLDATLRAAETQNPNVVAAEYAVEQAKADIDDTKGSLLPELNLVGSGTHSYGQSVTIPGRYDSSQVMLQLTVPLYKSGADYARIRAAQQTSVQRRMELQEAQHRAHEAARKSWQALQAAEASIAADKDETTAAAKALDGVKEQSRVGTRTTLDVLNAEQELLDAKTDLAKVEHDRALALVQIKVATGSLTVTALNLPVDPYDPARHYDRTHSAWIGFGGQDDDVYAKPVADAATPLTTQTP